MKKRYADGIRVFFEDARFCLYDICVTQKKDGQLLRGQRYPHPPKMLILHSHFCYEAHLITKGSYTFLLQEKDGDTSLTAGENTLLLLPPGTPHISDVNNSDFSSVIISFGLSRIPDEGNTFTHFFTKRLSELSKTLIPVKPSDTEKIAEYAHRIGEAPEFLDFGAEKEKPLMSIRAFCQRKTEACSLFTHLFRISGVFDRDEEYMRRQETGQDILLENLINVNPDYSLEDIAGALGYSVRYTSILIREQYGVSIAELREQTRFHTLRALLRVHPDYSLEACEELAGFGSRSSAIRAVRRYAGCTPTELKKKLTEETFSSKNEGGQ